MNKQKFIELLKKPSSITKEEVNGLESVVRQYPYFQSAHLVLAKGSKLTKDPKTKRRLARAAVYCTDRVLLKKYITGELFFLDSVNSPPLKIEEEPPKKRRAAPKPTAGKTPVSKKPQPKPTPQPPSTPSPITNDDPSFDPNSVLDEIKGSLEAYKTNKKNFEEYIQNDEEDKAVSEALHKASSLSTDEDPVENPAEDPQSDSVSSLSMDERPAENLIEDPIIESVDSQEETEAISEEGLDSSDDINIKDIIDEIKNTEDVQTQTEAIDEVEIKEPAVEEVESGDSIEAEQESKKEEKEKPVSYKNRIVISGSNRSKDNRKEAEDKIETEEKKVIKKEEVPVKESSPVASEPTADELNKPPTEENSSEVAEEAPSQNFIDREKEVEDDKSLSSGALRKAKMKKLKMQKDIINDFIDSAPQMPAPKQPSAEEEKEGNKDLSETRSIEEEEVISENMAIIYKNQGKIDKAIGIYNKLILKFPQKEAYFAARIKELK